MNKHNLDSLRQTVAYYLSIAITTLFPKAQCMQTKATGKGFYCDVHFNQPITADQFKVIEERMRDLMRQDMQVNEMEMMSSNAADLFKAHNQDLRAVYLKTIDEPTVKVLHIGPYYELSNSNIEFYDQKISVFKLVDIEQYKTSLPGRRNLTVSRLLGTAFLDQKALKDFLKKVEDTKDQDHVVIAQEKDLFLIKDVSAPETWDFLPKGAYFKESLEKWLDVEYKNKDYSKVITSDLLKKKTTVFPEIFFTELQSYHLNSDKTVNHAAIYSSKHRNIRDLPYKIVEKTKAYVEESEEKRGFFTTKTYSIDKSTFFCPLELLEKEVISSLQFIDKAVKIFGVEANWRLINKSSLIQSTSKKWEEAKSSLINAINACGINYEHDNEPKACYGPTLELYFTDVWGQQWLGSFVSIDVYHPDKLALDYQDLSGELKVPVMVTQSYFGSIERLMALLIEKDKGLLPLWLIEEPVRLVPLEEKQLEYCYHLQDKLKNKGIQAGVDFHKESLNVKIGSKNNVPFVLMVREENVINLHCCKESRIEENIDFDKFLEQLKLEIELKSSRFKSSRLNL